MLPRTVPGFLTHYYEFSKGPFLSLSRLGSEQAEHLLRQIRHKGEVFASQRSDDYLQIRRGLEDRVRRLFIKKGGRPLLHSPHYMILGSCPWVRSWYVDGREVCVPLDHIPPSVVSFTYGDTFPAMRRQDGKPHRGQVYTLEELPELIGRYGLPQEWNPDGKHGPDRYIEAQVWDSTPIQRFLDG
mgnify:CR=1 FL=1